MVAERPDELDELDLVVGPGRGDELAEGFEVDGVLGRPEDLDGASERGDGAGVVGEPEPADPGVSVGLGPLRVGRERLERRCGRRPEARLRPADRLGKAAHPLGVEARGGRGESVAVLEPGEDGGVGEDRVLGRGEAVVLALLGGQLAGQRQMGEGRRVVAESGQEGTRDADHARQAGAVGLGDGRHGALKLGDPGERPLGLQHAADEQRIGGDVLRLPPEELAERRLRLGGLALADEDQGLADQQPGVRGLLAQTFVEGVERALDLPRLEQALGPIGVGFHLLAAPLELLAAAARARGIRVDARHRSPSWGLRKCPVARLFSKGTP